MKGTPIPCPGPVIVPGRMPDSYPLCVPKGCVLCLDMQDRGKRIFDHSGYANHGTVNGGPTLAAGPTGCVRNFDGSDDAITITGDKIGIGDVTIEAWIYSGSTSAVQEIISNPTSSAEKPLYLRFDGTNTRLKLTSDNAASWPVSATGSVPLNTWCHALVVRLSDSLGKVTFYVNGKASGTASQSSGLPTAGGNTKIGANWSARWFNGKIGIVRIYNRALSAGEAKESYLQDAWRYGKG